MLGDVDLFATGESGLQLLGNAGAGGEATDKLEAGFAQSVRAALVGGELARDVSISTRDGGAAIHVGKDVTAVGDPAPPVPQPV